MHDTFKVDEVTVPFGHLHWVTFDFMHCHSELEQVYTLLTLDYFIKELNADIWTITIDTGGSRCDLSG